MKQDTLSENDRRKVASYIETNSGIRCPSSKHSLIETRLRKRQRVLGFASLKDYIHHALETPDGESEKLHLLDALTTNKTDFYREIEHFQFLRLWLSEQLKQNGSWHGTRQLRCWSAGCSTGEEPYTLAIELLELKRGFPDLRFSILATDISLSCLQTARKAVYPHQRIEPMNTELRRRYLLRSRDSTANLVQIAPEVRKTVSFESFNLLLDDYRKLGLFDLIFCRNVMIYFDNRDRAAINNQFAKCLNQNGLLFIGHSETLIGDQGFFVRLRPTVYQRIGSQRI